jgi:hypothetical protein
MWVRGFHYGASDFCLVSTIQLPEQYRDNDHFLSASSSSRHETLVDGALSRGSTLRVGLGVGGATVASGSRAHPSHSCDGWVCHLVTVGVSSIFGLVRGSGSFAVVFPTFALVSRMQLAQQYRGNCHFLSAASSSRQEAIIGGTLSRGSTLRVGLGVSGSDIVSGSRALPSHSWISHLLTSSLSLGTSSLFCRTTRCM